jgi:hypothetical protein
MIAVQFPDPDFRIKSENGKTFVFDSLRKQWMVLTEEEWVRQNFINFLVRKLNYPETLIAVEKEIRLGELTKRFDLLVYNKAHQPWMLVECKASSVRIDESVFQQVLRYHLAIPCTFLIITNGQYTIGWEKTEGTLKELQQMPPWD